LSQYRNSPACLLHNHTGKWPNKVSLVAIPQ